MISPSVLYLIFVFYYFLFFLNSHTWPQRVNKWSSIRVSLHCDCIIYMYACVYRICTYYTLCMYINNLFAMNANNDRNSINCALLIFRANIWLKCAPWGQVISTRIDSLIYNVYVFYNWYIKYEMIYILQCWTLKVLHMCM